ncbi:MAG: Asp-tRNA(Asn)/Glu-tRNA(Gln) amidotransferase subunit GatC [Holosporales bacterium]|nr:Asp-tRNA(Asn)/Glu-tRNA(Gln) amidotransferase subunit GatC [Holosporales bacterium]
MLTDDELEKISKLAGLRIPDQKRKAFLEGMSSILDWIDQIAQLDVSGVKDDRLEQTVGTPERPDVPAMHNTRDELLSNTQHQKFGMFSVPKMVE